MQTFGKVSNHAADINYSLSCVPVTGCNVFFIMFHTVMISHFTGAMDVVTTEEPYVIIMSSQLFKYTDSFEFVPKDPDSVGSELSATQRIIFLQQVQASAAWTFKVSLH